MWASNKNIDDGRPFDWDRTSLDYAQYRDIYPDTFYRRILARGLCTDGQAVLDLGTGTGVLPRNMYRYGAKWTGTDLSERQIEQARILSDGMDIEYHAVAAEDLSFRDHSFDVVTACQCFSYFDHAVLMPLLHRMLTSEGRILILYMAWLPFEDSIAEASENLLLKYNPAWSGARETVHPISIPPVYKQRFDLVHHEEFRLSVPFTRRSWHGRWRTCRGAGASLDQSELLAWEREHTKLLEESAPEAFDVLHYGALAELKKR